MQGGPEACLGGPRKQVHATWDVSRARCDGGDVNPRRPDQGARSDPPGLPWTAWMAVKEFQE